jgi:hypothetical protein
MVIAFCVVRQGCTSHDGKPGFITEWLTPAPKKSLGDMLRERQPPPRP